ncbi:hypothetical protein O6H91_18G061200 [Diphasiastrum complanatum]|uniref:Uncharacterized protein n=1 Tax=Diphasiastrum complanatum TaxID=34168 RepID=A0ACC2B1Y7_DIPCM|nr:hypothetical protein O6H91_Y396700 [Diphasiastrum complanatum]KAJ7523745.1 hypothetical protein O6H91_18G061200 [Diphasiastrum complanatum]
MKLGTMERRTSRGDWKGSLPSDSIHLVGASSDPRLLLPVSSIAAPSPSCKDCIYHTAHSSHANINPSSSTSGSSSRSHSGFTLQRYPSRLHDRTPVLHSRVIKLRTEDQYLREIMSMEVLDLFRDDLSTTNHDSRSIFPSPLGIRGFCANP